jgi:hypothetical protein
MLRTSACACAKVRVAPKAGNKYLSDENACVSTGTLAVGVKHAYVIVYMWLFFLAHLRGTSA